MAKSSAAKPRSKPGYDAFLEKGARDVIPSRRGFIETFIRIPDKKKTNILVPFRFNRVQRRLEAARLRAERLKKPFRAATLKARQFGVTKQAQAWAIEEAIRTPYTQACIIAHREDLARTKLEESRMIRLTLPWEFESKYDNRAQLYFGEPVWSNIDIASAKTGDPCRGHTYRFVHATEPGLWDNPETKVASVMQSVPDEPGTYLCYEGTANGMGNWWHQFWWDAYEGRNDYEAFFFPWWYDPEFDYCLSCTEAEAAELRATKDDEERWLFNRGVMPGQIKWRRRHIRNNFPGNPELFRQEFPATPEEAFLVSGSPAFPPSHVTFQRARHREPIWRGEILFQGWREPQKPDFKMLAADRGSLEIWDQPMPGAKYVMGVDTGYGIKGGDYSVACVIDRDTSIQVAELTMRVAPHVFADLVYALGIHYNGAYLLPEANAVGQSMLHFLVERSYPNLGRRPVFDWIGKVYEQRFGFQTTVKTKTALVQGAAEVLASSWEQGQNRPGIEALVHSEGLIRELLEFQVEFAKDGGEVTYSAPGKRHDDRVMAWMIALLGRKDVLAREHPVEEKPRRRTIHELMWDDARDDYVPEEEPEDIWEEII